MGAPLGRMCHGGAHGLLRYLEYLLTWLLGAQEFILLLYTAVMHVTYSSVYIIHCTQKEKKGWYVLNSAHFPINPHSCPQLPEEGPGSLITVLFCFPVGQRNMGGEGLPSPAGPWLLRGEKAWGKQGQARPAGSALSANSGD